MLDIFSTIITSSVHWFSEAVSVGEDAEYTDEQIANMCEQECKHLKGGNGTVTDEYNTCYYDYCVETF